MPASLLKKITLYSRSLAHETYYILMLWCIYRKSLIHKWRSGILTYSQWCHFAVKFSVSLLCHLTTNCALFRPAAVLPDKLKATWNGSIELLCPFPKQVNHLYSFYLLQAQPVKLIEISIWKLYLLLFGLKLVRDSMCEWKAGMQDRTYGFSHWAHPITIGKKQVSGICGQSANMQPSLAQVSENTRPIRKCFFITAAHRTLHW